MIQKGEAFTYIKLILKYFTFNKYELKKFKLKIKF